jgi:hypothetical protein
MDGRPVTPTGPRPRPGNGMRVRAANQNYLAQSPNINAAERQRRLNQAAQYRAIGEEMNTRANTSAASSAASSVDYEKKLRAKVTAHNARTSMAKVSEAEVKQWELDLAKTLKGAMPVTAEVKRIGEAVRRNIKAKTGMVAGRSTRRNSRRSTRKQRRSTRRTVK